MMDKLNGCIFLIEDDELLQKYNTTWDKISADIKKDLESESPCKKIFSKTKIKPHDDKFTDFYGKEIPKADPNHICLAVIRLNSALNKVEDIIHKYI